MGQEQDYHGKDLQFLVGLFTDILMEPLLRF